MIGNLVILPEHVHMYVCMHVMQPFPPWERRGVSAYKAVSDCSLAAYKFTSRITTSPLLNNLCFT